MPYIIQTAAAHMPTTCKAPYRRVAVIEVEPEFANLQVSMISPRARGVVRIVQTWERLHARGINTAYAKALREAEAMIAILNAGGTP